MMKKRGLSPVIATMLLVAIVIVIALIVFLWFRGMTEEAITKFDGTNIKVVCDDVSFDADFSGNTIYIVNTGNVPIYKMKVKSYGEGSSSTEVLETNWPEVGLNQGGAYSGSIGATDRVLLIPVLIGHSEKGDLEHTCEERQGYEIYNA